MQGNQCLLMYSIGGTTYTIVNTGREGLCLLHAYRVLQIWCNMQISSSSTCSNGCTGIHVRLITVCHSSNSVIFYPSTLSSRASFMANGSKSTLPSGPLDFCTCNCSSTSRSGVNDRVEYLPSKHAYLAQKCQELFTHICLFLICSEQAICVAIQIGSLTAALVLRILWTLWIPSQEYISSTFGPVHIAILNLDSNFWG
jgi:hypothetical protein